MKPKKKIKWCCAAAEKGFGHTCHMRPNSYCYDCMNDPCSGQHTAQHTLTYGLEAGRLVTRDGKPFVTIHRVEREGAEYVNPTDADKFARDVVRAVNAHEELLGIARVRLACIDRGDDHGEWDKVSRIIAKAEGRP